MEGKDQEQGRSFKVEDRRRFTATGEPRDSVAEPEANERSVPPTEGPERETATQQFRMESPAPPPAITFSTFILSLSTQALAHLGDIPDPVTRQVQVDLAGASQIIDILAMLESKTRGNLDPEEVQLLRGILYDLRLRFVEKSRS
jgi:hypothetical protein